LVDLDTLEFLERVWVPLVFRAFAFLVALAFVDLADLVLLDLETFPPLALDLLTKDLEFAPLPLFLDLLGF
jgi:hypothetical protein